MIYNLPISLGAIQLVNQFIFYLKLSGYSGLKSYRTGVVEFIYRMEQEGILLEQVDQVYIKGHVGYLEQRPNYRDAGGLSSGTVGCYLYSLRLFFNYLILLNFLEEDPMSGLRFNFEQSGAREILSVSEVKILYEVCINVQERALLSLFYGCGLRKSEVSSLNIRDVDLKGNWLYVRSGKGKKRRVVPLTAGIKKDLKNYYYELRPLQISDQTKGTQGLSFMLNSCGRRLQGSSSRLYFKKILERSGLEKKVSLHHLRHSVATHLLASGLSVEEVRDFLGHESLETTQLYTRVYLSNYGL